MNVGIRIGGRGAHILNFGMISGHIHSGHYHEGKAPRYLWDESR